MRTKRRSASIPLASLFDPPQTPEPGPAALAEARSLLRLLLLQRAVAPPENPDAAPPPSTPDHQRQSGGGQAGERDADSPEGDAFDHA